MASTGGPQETTTATAGTPEKDARKASRQERRALRREHKAQQRSQDAGEPSAAPSARQLPALLRAAHPRQAVLMAVLVGVLVALTRDDSAKEALVSAAAVLVAQLAMGLSNDLADVELDRASGVEGKPIAAGVVPAGNASFVVLLLLLLAIPLSLQNGLLAGAFLLATLVVGYVHNRWLHRTLLSFVGWAATFALLTFFVTYGGWGRAADGSAPLTSFVVLCALLGVCVHFLTSLGDLVADNTARVRHLPLRVALSTGAPRLLVISVVATVVVLVAIVVVVVQAGAIAR